MRFTISAALLTFLVGTYAAPVANSGLNGRVLNDPGM
jgi:hypothetical protein